MSKTYMTDTQQLRIQHAHSTHKNLKELIQATKDALKYQQKYFDAMEKMMHCFSTSSKDVEEMRMHVREETAAQVHPTTSATARLLSAHDKWRTSDEMSTIRVELETLQQVCTTECISTKKMKNTLEDWEKTAKKCSEVNSHKYEEKMNTASTSKQEKMLRKKIEGNANMASAEDTVMNDMGSLTASLSDVLSARVNALYAAFASFGYGMASSFSVNLQRTQNGRTAPPEETMPPALFASHMSPQPHSGDNMSVNKPSASLSPLHSEWSMPGRGKEGEGAAYTTPDPVTLNGGKCLPL